MQLLLLSSLCLKFIRHVFLAAHVVVQSFSKLNSSTNCAKNFSIWALQQILRRALQQFYFWQYRCICFMAMCPPPPFSLLSFSTPLLVPMPNQKPKVSSQMPIQFVRPWAQRLLWPSSFPLPFIVYAWACVCDCECVYVPSAHINAPHVLLPVAPPLPPAALMHCPGKAEQVYLNCKTCSFSVQERIRGASRRRGPWNFCWSYRNTKNVGHDVCECVFTDGINSVKKYIFVRTCGMSILTAYKQTDLL